MNDTQENIKIVPLFKNDPDKSLSEDGFINFDRHVNILSLSVEADKFGHAKIDSRDMIRDSVKLDTYNLLLEYRGMRCYVRLCAPEARARYSRSREHGRSIRLLDMTYSATLTPSPAIKGMMLEDGVNLDTLEYAIRITSTVCLRSGLITAHADVSCKSEIDAKLTPISYSVNAEYALTTDVVIDAPKTSLTIPDDVDGKDYAVVVLEYVRDNLVDTSETESMHRDLNEAIDAINELCEDCEDDRAEELRGKIRLNALRRKFEEAQLQQKIDDIARDSMRRSEEDSVLIEGVAVRTSDGEAISKNICQAIVLAVTIICVTYACVKCYS